MEAWDGGKDPAMVVSALNQITLMVSDPAIVQDMFTTKMSHIDKDPLFGRVASPYLGDGFILSSAFYPKYKPRRKHVSRAFHKEKLEVLSGHLKGFLKSSITEWYNEIDASKEGMTTIDVSNDFE